MVAVEQKREMFSSLQKLMKGMKLPDHRKMNSSLVNIEWLLKNMDVHNSSHKNLTAAKKLCEDILQAG